MICIFNYILNSIYRRADIIARARGCPGEGDWRKRFLGLAGGGAPLPLGRSTEVEVVAGLSPCELREGILNLAEGEREHMGEEEKGHQKRL